MKGQLSVSGERMCTILVNLNTNKQIDRSEAVPLLLVFFVCESVTSYITFFFVFFFFFFFFFFVVVVFAHLSFGAPGMLCFVIVAFLEYILKKSFIVLTVFLQVHYFYWQPN